MMSLLDGGQHNQTEISWLSCSLDVSMQQQLDLKGQFTYILINKLYEDTLKSGEVAL